MPFSEFFEMTHLRIPKERDGSATGFELDCKELLKLSECAKNLCNIRDEVLSHYAGSETTDPTYEKLSDAYEVIDQFVAWFYPATQEAGVTGRVNADDLPTFDIPHAPSRADRRLAERQSKKRATFRPGEGWSN